MIAHLVFHFRHLRGVSGFTKSSGKSIDTKIPKLCEILNFSKYVYKNKFIGISKVPLLLLLIHCATTQKSDINQKR